MLSIVPFLIFLQALRKAFNNQSFVVALANVIMRQANRAASSTKVEGADGFSSGKLEMKNWLKNV